MQSRIRVKLWIGAAGYCTHPEFLTIRGGSLRPVAFPAGFACIRHPQHGTILFDTGYSRRFFAETASLPESLYRYTTPVVYDERDHVIQQLQQAGVRANEIRYVILSHFHGDHIAAVRDFPQAQFIYLQEAYDAVRKLRSLRAVKAGFLRGLLPDDFEARSLPFTRRDLNVPYEPGSWNGVVQEHQEHQEHTVVCHDLFRDGSVLALELSGHADGMIGLAVLAGEQEYLLCADTVWSSRAFMDNHKPHLAAGIIMSNRQQYDHHMQRLRRWHLRHPQLRIVPSHCREALDAWGGEWHG
ncbi:MBL fold metallo-hydrolase [Paenibacillus campi]|uniref:MBL fold metallo-hydrolase n=1 Tax=Paenibacillus campi TaxID=3106031 RepID=UPI002B0011F0|nr:MBL fold metallo-hydrolase [Paenibacillus sp. SGZ-1014]